MKFKTCFAVAVTALCLSVSAFAKTEKAPAEGPKMDPKMMEAWTKASTPGEEHKMLQNYAGRWDYTVRWWMTPDSKPEVSQGTSEATMILGGRFLQHTVKGTSMGQPFEGIAITGYDNIKKQFSTLWIDNMSTAMMKGEGSFDQATNNIVDKGSMSCPMSPTGTRNYRAVMSLPKKDSYKYEMFMTGDDGKEFRSMEIVYRKAK